MFNRPLPVVVATGAALFTVGYALWSYARFRIQYPHVEGGEAQLALALLLDIYIVAGIFNLSWVAVVLRLARTALGLFGTVLALQHFHTFGVTSLVASTWRTLLITTIIVVGVLPSWRQMSWRPLGRRQPRPEEVFD